jgi:predicted Na+-dependent transporter
MGAPLLSVYFASAPQLLGFALLPLIFYHMWQLMVAGFMKSLPLMRVRRTQG